jgi:serine/threonine protein phosphatase PrpC
MAESSRSEVAVALMVDQFGQFIGPVRVWRKYEQLPGLMMSRSFGDMRAHTCGVISTPEIRNFKLDKTARAIVLGSDGMWEVMQPDQIKRIVAKYFRSKRSDEAASELLESSQTGWGKKVGPFDFRIQCTVMTSPA